MKQILVRNWYDYLISRRREIDEKLSILDMLKISFDFGSDSILLGYPRYAELTERSNQHSWKVTNSALPSIAIGDIECA